MNNPSDHWISELIRTVQECRSENSDQRFGQLLYNLIAGTDYREAEKGESMESYQENFHSRLFYIRDEDLVKILKDYQNGN